MSFIYFSISFYILGINPLSALAAAIINSQLVICLITYQCFFKNPYYLM